MSRLVTDNLPLLAGAPNGVKKLRELILELAVRGKLVAQDPGDEPAIELLKRITTEKTRLAGDKKAKTRVSDAPSLMELPNGWISTTLAEVAFINPRNKVDDALEVSFVPMALIGTSFKGAHSQESRAWHEVKQGFTHFAEGDVGIAKITPCFENSKACVFSGLKNNFGAGTTELHIVRPIADLLNARYILAYIKSPQFLLIGETRMTGTAGQKRLPKDFVENNPFPLPPLAEQARIVAKVDELMALCDRLETRQSDAQAAHARLVDELLGSLLQARDAEDFAECWGRVKGSFDVLFTTEQSVDALKQSILRLAVMGKLVEQDPTEEPANSLMSRLRKDRANWLQANSVTDAECRTMLRKLDPIKNGVLPFSTPKSWQTVSLIDCCRLVVDCHNKTAPYTGSGIPIIRTSNIRNREFRYEDLRFVSEETYEFWSRRCPPAPGDIMFTREAPMGEAAIVPLGKKFCLGQRIMLIRPMREYINTKYLLLALTEPNLLERASTDAIGSTVKHLRVGDVENLCLPLPPLAEQHRIVAKVDELMALCDQIKAKLARAQVLNERLTGALVEGAVS